MKIFFAKLLLFGEYGLMFGARALAVPYLKYSGHLVNPGEAFQDPASKKSTVELERFASWFQHEQLNSRMNFQLDLKRLTQDISKNMFFQSDIPMEYGVGSSGALCAALFHDYSIYGKNLNQVGKKHSLSEALKNDFSVMESYFHGRSSGLDPLVSFLNQPVLFDNNQISLPSIRTDRLSYSVYLLDTGSPGATSPLVSRFLDKMQDADFRTIFNRDYLPASDGAVGAFLQGKHDQLFHHLKRLTRFQLDHLSAMIPLSFVEIIEQMLLQGICVKLLGSGGGGFLLAFVPRDSDEGLIKNGLKVF
jgi:mevalonate kinase